MAKIPVRFKRVADAFDKAARSRPCESSGSEHLKEDSDDLSDMVDSFMESNFQVTVDGGEEEENKKLEKEKKHSDRENNHHWSNSETKETIQSLLCRDEDDVKRSIHEETELACRVIGNSSSEGFKRRLMRHLRERGFDAGLCKSRWEKTGRFPAGYYYYVDVKVAGTRYVVEHSFAEEFRIARPTNCYLSLVEVLPGIFVGKPEELKQVVRLMCAAVKESLKSRDLHVPPWRTNGYMQAKWFGSYKRTTNAVPDKKISDVGIDLAEKRSGCGDSSPAIFYYCRSEFESKVGLKVGNLAAALGGAHL